MNDSFWVQWSRQKGIFELFAEDFSDNPVVHLYGFQSSLSESLILNKSARPEESSLWEVCGPVEYIPSIRLQLNGICRRSRLCAVLHDAAMVEKRQVFPTGKVPASGWEVYRTKWNMRLLPNCEFLQE